MVVRGAVTTRAKAEKCVDPTARLTAVLAGISSGVKTDAELLVISLWHLHGHPHETESNQKSLEGKIKIE